MKYLTISVEGQTEETFVREVLHPYFIEHDLWLNPILLTTRHVPNAPNRRGGFLSYSKMRKELLTLLGDSSVIAVTTIYDFYGLPKDIPGYETIPSGRGLNRVSYIEKAFGHDIDNPKFHPYLQLHEFEALLFTDINITNKSLFGDQKQLDRIRKIKREYATPEDINEDENTAPSKRIKSIYPSYQKAYDGPIITQEIGLTRLREVCPHFNAWVTWIESLR
ncbi:MAG: DUF4276 family protein [Anaerolineae bacterium]|nr:DUF4276 family protein [Anaerolineae bacterium]